MKRDEFEDEKYEFHISHLQEWDWVGNEKRWIWIMRRVEFDVKMRTDEYVYENKWIGRWRDECEDGRDKDECV